MSLSTVKKAVMWLDHEGKAPKHPAAISELGDVPAPWISLRSSVSFSDKSDDTVSIHTSALQQLEDITFSKSARRVRSVAAVEKKPDHQEGSGSDSRTSITAPIDSNIVYPSKFGLTLICVSLCLSTFMVSLDMSILTTAM